MPAPHLPRQVRRRHHCQRGSLLITALLIAAVLGLALVGYIALSQNALKLAHRTLFTNDAGNLAEAGIEEALYCYNQMNAGTSAAKAWTGWTTSGGNATRTLAPFNRDQHAVGTVKVFVSGFDGGNPDPYVISQATITPFDRSPPVVKIVQINLGKNAYFTNGLVGIKGLTMSRDGLADSYNSNPTNRPNGPWAAFSTKAATGNTSVAVAAGSLNATSRNIIRGDLYLGKGVATGSIKVTGAIRPDFNGIFPMPDYPTMSDAPAPVYSRRRGKPKKIKTKVTKLASVLPQKGDTPADDGRYYYFCDNFTIGDVTISPGADVTIVGTRTDMVSGLAISSKATCRIYIDGPITITANNSGKEKDKDKGNDKNSSIESGDWAGALQIYTTTSRDCLIETDSTIYACVYAPNAPLRFTGDIDLPTTIVGSFVAGSIRADDNVNFIYDEALTTLSEGKIWSLATWSELRTGSDRATLGTLTDKFLP